jgi:hypothetical protein
MRGIINVSGRLAALGLALAVLGCQANGDKTRAAAPVKDLAACSACRVSTVTAPIDAGKGRVGGYISKKEMTCPDCRGAVDNLVSTGKFEHACKRRAAGVETCDAH